MWLFRTHWNFSRRRKIVIRVLRQKNWNKKIIICFPSMVTLRCCCGKKKHRVFFSPNDAYEKKIRENGAALTWTRKYCGWWVPPNGVGWTTFRGWHSSGFEYLKERENLKSILEAFQRRWINIASLLHVRTSRSFLSTFVVSQRYKWDCRDYNSLSHQRNDECVRRLWQRRKCMKNISHVFFSYILDIGWKKKTNKKMLKVTYPMELYDMDATFYD